MCEADFVFVGYLVQEPYPTSWWKRPRRKLASLENDVHPSLEQPQWEIVNGVRNQTGFLIRPPDMAKYPGWLLCAYAIERDAIDRIRVQMVDRSVRCPLAYEYALHLKRGDDRLRRMGYEVMDARIDRLSILNNCGYEVEEVEIFGGPLNQYCLFDRLEDAKRFRENIRTKTPNDSHSDGVIFEVWGPA
jgi:hypothetical protein